MYKNILVPVVLGEDQNHEMSFSAARRLAEDDAKFTVLHVREAIPTYAAAEIPRDILAAAQERSLSDLKELAAKLPGATPSLVNGRAGRAILDFADANNVDCIVIASQKPGLQTLFLGSTANTVVQQAKCSVHVIR